MVTFAPDFHFGDSAPSGSPHASVPGVEDVAEEEDGAPQGIYAYVPLTTRRGRDVEVETNENDTLSLPRGRVAEIVAADWGTDEQVVDVTDIVKSLLTHEGSLEVPATVEVLGEGPGEPRTLLVRYVEAFYVLPDDQLATVDPNSTEGIRLALELDNERLVANNVRMKELLSRYQGRELHFKDVEERLSREIQERVKLQQAVYETEGPLVAVHVQELERENARLRKLLENERQSCVIEQQQRQRAEEELSALRDIRHGSPDTLENEVGMLRKENDRLHVQTRELSRLNAALQRTLREQSEVERARAQVFDEDVAADTRGRAGQYVRVRRAALCQRGRAMVDQWERDAASRAAAQGSVPLSDPPPQSSTHPRTTTLLTRHGGTPDYRRPPHLPPPLPPPGHPGAVVGSRPLRASGVSAREDSGWREFVTPEGRPIFHNVATAATQFERPAALR